MMAVAIMLAAAMAAAATMLVAKQTVACSALHKQLYWEFGGKSQLCLHYI